MVALAPAGLVVTGCNLSSFLAVPVILVLILSVEIYDRAGISYYIAGGLFVGVGVSFGFHNVQLIVPLLFAHFMSARVPREGIFRLLFDGRFIFLMISFIISSALFSSSAGKGFLFIATQTGSNPFSHIHPLSLFSYSSVGEQFSLLYSSSEPLSILMNLSQTAGPLATLFSLGGCIYALFCEKLRRWRPVAVYILVAVALRIVPGYPGFDMASELVAPMILIVAVNLLQQVSRVGYRFQRTLFIGAAVVFSFSPLWLIVSKGTAPQKVTFEREVYKLLLEGKPIVNCTQIGTFFVSGSKSTRLPLPYSKDVSAQAIYNNWAKTLEPLGNLRKSGATYGVVNMAFLKQLEKKIESSNLSERVGRIASQLSSLEKVTADGDNDKSVIIVRF
jgi:hypothetical protein